MEGMPQCQEVDCLDANAVQDLMSGALDAAARAAAIAHLDDCADCRDLISLLARDATRDAAVDTLRTETHDAHDAHDAPGDPPGPGAALGETQSSVAVARPIRDPALVATATASARRTAKKLTSPGMSGRVLGRYTLLERLGAGAMGVVYRADDIGLGRQVALKLLHRPDGALTDRLNREARSMAQVNHPNVVAVYD